jgi:hypothetical protein
MNANTHNERGDLSVEWVEDRLRALAAVEPPESLKDRLVAGIADAGTAKPKDRYLGLWSREVRWASAAAAVILVASVIGWLESPLGPQAQSAPNASDGTGWAQATDHNSLRASDTNSCDTNSLR